MKITPCDHTRFCDTHKTANKHDVVFRSTVGKRQKKLFADVKLGDNTAIGRLTVARQEREKLVGHFISLPDILSPPLLWCQEQVYIAVKKNGSAIEYFCFSNLSTNRKIYFMKINNVIKIIYNFRCTYYKINGIIRGKNTHNTYER